MLNKSDDLNSHNWSEIFSYSIKSGDKINAPIPLFKKFKKADLINKYNKLKKK